VSLTDREQLVLASRLYYELGETQHAVAERLGVTRPQVSRLLKRARAEGIVEIRIVDSAVAESPVADVLRQRFGLAAVHLAPTVAGPEDLIRRMVGRVAAQVLRASVRDGDIVGIGDGASVTAMADSLDDAPSPIAATVVPLAGGYWTPGPEREPFRRVASALGAQAHGLMAPGLLDDVATRSALVAHAGVQAMLELWARLDVVLYGIGGPLWGRGSVGPDITARLDDADAVGEILIAPFDLAGAFIVPELRSRALAFDARALGQVPTSIAVAAGASKVRPILGALRSGVVRTLVTDVATAEAVHQLDDDASTTRRADTGAVR
jgi:DNA-binding transcriptional regulator LsrR (DeoR family)